MSDQDRSIRGRRSAGRPVVPGSGGAAGAAAARHGAVPQLVHAAGRGPRELGAADRRGGVGRPHDRRLHPARGLRGGSAPGRPVRHRHRQPHPQDVQAARRQPAHHRPGPGPRASRRHRRQPAVPAGQRQRGARGAGRPRPARDRRAAAQHQGQLPADRLAVAADVRRPADAGLEHHRAGPGRRLHRLEPGHDVDRRQAGSARDARRAHAPRQPEPPAHQGARGARARLEDPVAGAVGGRQEPARLLPARAAEGDPARARRRRRPVQGRRGAAPEDRCRRAARGGEEGSAARARPAVEDAAGRRRVHGVAHLSRLDRRAAVDQAHRRGDRPAEDARQSSTPSTPGSTRPRSASSNTWRCASSTPA